MIPDSHLEGLYNELSGLTGGDGMPYNGSTEAGRKEACDWLRVVTAATIPDDCFVTGVEIDPATDTAHIHIGRVVPIDLDSIEVRFGE